MTHCAPGIKPICDKDGRCSCFDKAALVRIIKDYNKRHGTQIHYRSNMREKTLRKLIDDKLASEEEWYWMDQDYLKNDPYLTRYLKPPIPEGKEQWLTTDNINHVMKQFEEQYSDFRFFGPVPIDFDQVFEEIANINLCKLYSDGISRLGFIFNLDPSDQGGSHWVALFIRINRKDPFMGYFDSFGVCPPPTEIQTLMYRLQEQIRGCLGLDLVFRCNPRQHQKNNTECGVYCLNFIAKSLEGKSFDQICGNVICDEVMNDFRGVFFRPTMKSPKSTRHFFGHDSPPLSPRRRGKYPRGRVK